MILLIIFQPGLVTHYRNEIPTLTDEQIQQNMPGFDGGGGLGIPLQNGDGLGGGPNFGDDALGGGGLNFGDTPASPSAPSNGGLPGLELPGLDGLDGPAAPPSAPAQPSPTPLDDLNAPPTINLD